METTITTEVVYVLIGAVAMLGHESAARELGTQAKWWQSLCVMMLWIIIIPIVSFKLFWVAAHTFTGGKGE